VMGTILKLAATSNTEEAYKGRGEQGSSVAKTSTSLLGSKDLRNTLLSLVTP